MQEGPVVSINLDGGEDVKEDLEEEEEADIIMIEEEDVMEVAMTGDVTIGVIYVQEHALYNSLMAHASKSMLPITSVMMYGGRSQLVIVIVY